MVFKTIWFWNKRTPGRILKDKHTIIDKGCGLGYKAAWFAELAPHAIVLGTDITDAIDVAAKKYCHLPNLFFFRGDIADTGIKNGVIDFTVCLPSIYTAGFYRKNYFWTLRKKNKSSTIIMEFNEFWMVVQVIFAQWENWLI